MLMQLNLLCHVEVHSDFYVAAACSLSEVLKFEHGVQAFFSCITNIGVNTYLPIFDFDIC